MIIEFTGIPGVGKSTIINEIIKSGIDKTIVIDVEKYIKANFYFNLPGLIGFDIILIVNFFKLKKNDCRLLLKSFVILFFNKNISMHSINIFRNIYKKLVIHRVIQNKNKIFILDEGLSHIPMSLFINVNRDIVNTTVIDFLKYIPRADRLILIDADDSILLKRVLIRGEKGHRRIDFSNRNNVVSFVNKSRDVIEILKKELKPHIYYNNSNVPNFKEIIQILNIKDV
jgi:hypothetical protein